MVHKLESIMFFLYGRRKKILIGLVVYYVLITLYDLLFLGDLIELKIKAYGEMVIATVGIGTITYFALFLREKCKNSDLHEMYSALFVIMLWFIASIECISALFVGISLSNYLLPLIAYEVIVVGAMNMKLEQ